MDDNRLAPALLKHRLEKLSCISCANKWKRRRSIAPEQRRWASHKTVSGRNR